MSVGASSSYPKCIRFLTLLGSGSPEFCTPSRARGFSPIRHSVCRTGGLLLPARQPRFSCLPNGGSGSPPPTSASSSRPACRFSRVQGCRDCLLFDTSSYHYKSLRPGQAVLEQRIKKLPDAGALWLSACSRAAMPRRLADQPQEDLSRLSRDGPATAPQHAQASGQGEAAGRRPNETWAWTSCTTSWRPAARSGC